MKKIELAPGMLPVFRLVTALRLGLVILALVGGVIFQINEPRPGFVPFVMVAECSLLLAYLFSQWLQRKLGWIYLPIALAIASLGPITEQYLGLLFRAQSDNGLMIRESVLAGSWQLIPILFIPLVLIGAQYNFKSVLAFAFFTSLYEMGLTWLIPVDLTLLRLIISGMVFLRTVTFVLVGYIVVRLFTSQRTQRQALSLANARLAHYAATLEQLTVSRERNRLARELHDTLAHSLSGVAVQLEAVKSLWDSCPEDAQAMLDQSLATTRRGLGETRRALQALRASPLDDLGLGLALRQLAESAALRAGLSLKMDIPDELYDLTPDIEQGIYRVTQEALENVIQHSQAKTLKVALDQLSGDLTLRIVDDGVGFDPQQPSDIAQFGLRGMRERTELLGGALEVESAPAQGTKIRLVFNNLPLNDVPIEGKVI
jgi:signal transduction histidine kinase